ncbi:MAG: class I SAM-dependent RNA methyltransferase [Labilithrix sp.]|nr:class I SAM-dependent RNA methyltransferase [Labilithrix sp.]
MRTLTVEAEIGELAPGGEGVAICTIDGERRAVFVPGVLTGERVRAEVDLERRPARGRLLAVLEPSASRVTPPCAHVARCGGCDWMSLSPEAQAREHAAIVGRLLGGAPPRSHHAVRALGYRTRARVHAESKRGRVIVGMFGRRSHEPAAVDTCVVLDPVLDRARDALAGWLEGATGRGEAELGLGRPGEPRMAVLELRWSAELPGAVFGRLERAVKEGALAGARVFSGGASAPGRDREPRRGAAARFAGAPAKIGDPTPFIVGADDAPLRLAPGGFSQATEAGNLLLARRVAELARELAPGPCVELYAGAGNLTVLLARDREVVAVEQDHDACEAARENVAARGLSARVVEADASAYAIPRSARLVVLDPPREGARAVAEALAARAAKGAAGRAPAVVYVACDPPTLARDAKTLTAAGYAVRTVETFEMFPQTSHVETVVVFDPPARPASGA